MIWSISSTLLEKKNYGNTSESIIFVKSAKFARLLRANFSGRPLLKSKKRKLNWLYLFTVKSIFFSGTRAGKNTKKNKTEYKNDQSKNIALLF